MRLEKSDRDAINRANSLKSTGPKSDAGKKRSSLNACRHGLSGQVVLMPGEDLAELERFTKGIYNSLKPVGDFEKSIAQSIADRAWRLDRAAGIEVNLLSYGMYQHSDSILTENDHARDAIAMVLAVREQAGNLNSISLYHSRLDRAQDRQITQLRKIQAERLVKEDAEMYAASELYLLHAEENSGVDNPEPYRPSDDGFVLTIDQIRINVHRQQRRRHAREAEIKV